MNEKDYGFIPFGGEQKELDEQSTVYVKNPEVEKALEIYAKDRNAENLNTLINHMHQGRYLLPATLASNNKPAPMFLKNKEGASFMAIYTSLEQIPAEPKLPALMNMDFENIVKMGADERVPIIGICINPFTNNMIFKKELLQKIVEVDESRKNMSNMKTVKLTEDQYHVMMRKQFEFANLPKQFFAEGQAFVDALSSRKEEFVDEIYEKSYQEQRLYPYLSEEFSVMAMEIQKDLTVISIDFPARYGVVPYCQRVYFTWDPTTEKGHYYTIEVSAEKNVRLLGEFGSDLKRIDHGKASVEGTGLQQIIDLHKEAALTS